MRPPPQAEGEGGVWADAEAEPEAEAELRRAPQLIGEARVAQLDAADDRSDGVDRLVCHDDDGVARRRPRLLRSI